MQKKYDVYAVGNALVDIEYQVSDDFLSQWQIDKGVMTLVEAERQIGVIAELAKSPSEKACGGSAANSIMAIQRFGGQTFYSCKVANDELGDFYRQDLMGAGVDTNLSENRPDGVTGTCLVLVTPDAERTLNTYLGITETVSDTELDPQAIANAQYLYLEGYLAGSETGRMTAVIAAGIAREQGVKVALTFSDPNIVQFCRAGLEDMVGSGVDLLFCNEKEALMWADTEDLESAKAELKLFAKTVVITLGSRGAWIGHQEGEVMIQAYPVKAPAVAEWQLLRFPNPERPVRQRDQVCPEQTDPGPLPPRAPEPDPVRDHRAQEPDGLQVLDVSQEMPIPVHR